MTTGRQVHLGLAGYWFEQVTGDSGAGAEWYVNLKAYWEFAAVHRAAGWNLWLALAVPLERSKTKAP